jgi:hypothetical protein
MEELKAFVLEGELKGVTRAIEESIKEALCTKELTFDEKGLHDLGRHITDHLLFRFVALTEVDHRLNFNLEQPQLGILFTKDFEQVPTKFLIFIDFLIEDKTICISNIVADIDPHVYDSHMVIFELKNIQKEHDEQTTE